MFITRSYGTGLQDAGGQKVKSDCEPAEDLGEVRRQH
jgi:hypothetical protein